MFVSSESVTSHIWCMCFLYATPAKTNVLKWNSLHTSSAVTLQACSSLTFSSVPAVRIPQSSLNFHRSKNKSVFAFCIPWQILLFPFVKTKAQLDTTQLRCCCPRNNLGKVGLDFSSASTTFCEFWRHCLCPNPSWEKEQTSPERRAVWLMLYRNKQGSVTPGWRIKFSSAPFPPANQLHSSLGALPLLDFGTIL